MFITSGSGGPAYLQWRDRRLHVCCQDGHINTWTSRCCFHCQTVCRWKAEEEAERRQHGPTEAGHLRPWVSASEPCFCLVGFYLWHLFSLWTSWKTKYICINSVFDCVQAWKKRCSRCSIVSYKCQNADLFPQCDAWTGIMEGKQEICETV